MHKFQLIQEANVENTAVNKLTHHKSRAFKPEKLTVPRDFQLPRFVQQSISQNSNQQQLSQGSQSLPNDQDKQNNRRPLIVEIGAGKGRHAILYAASHPQHDVIAIERTLNKFAAFESLVKAASSDPQASDFNNESKKLRQLNLNNALGSDKQLNLDNLLPVHADAIPYCVYALPAQSVDAFYLLYPNPEPKNSNQQWLNMPFFEFLLSRLKPEGKVILASNIEEYIDNAYQQAIDTWQLDTQRIQVATDSQRTHFEIKYLARGETCWELNLTKPKGYVTRFDRWQAQLVYTFSE
ncbi:class I SAM-dependent methyltransferase [Psychrobacter lutiphocae]|uniref:hypothetical protein n=1 Tax=Psychrobacter lutiphocae TaxID=540500 RepID=UPI00036E1674|nr:hypothetical protein [Psychrobacter lutiphocae]